MSARPAGRVRLGGWLAMPEPLVVEAAAKSGYDWIGLDLQHGAWDLGAAFRAIQLLDALGKSVTVRIHEEELPLIPRVLDHGASGIVLAMASSPETVAAALEHARYQPTASRSYGGQRYGMRPEPADLTELCPHIYPMIETRQALESITRIAAVPGVAGLHIGPTDLSLALSFGLNRTPPVYDNAIKAIVAAGHSVGIPVTMHAVHRETIADVLKFGFDELVLTTDIELLRGAMLDQVTNARSVIDGTPSTATLGAFGRSPLAT
jgi:4-hydroxy-2-oxoheptanedioate aldolase